MLNEQSSINNKNMIAEYEDHIAALTEEIQVYKEEQSLLINELKTLMTENSSLMSHIQNIIGTNLEIPHQYNDIQFNDNLRSQLNLALQEKEAAYNLWQDSLQTIDLYESELKLLRDLQSKTYITRNKNNLGNFEKEIDEMRRELETCKTSKEALEKATKIELQKKNEELEKSIEEQHITSKLVKKLEREINEIKEKQEEIVEIKNETLKELNMKTITINNLTNKENNLKLRLAEALQLVEAAIIEKDAALQREIQAKEQMEKLNKIMAEIVDETRDKVKNEIEITETKYNVKLKKLTIDLDSLKEEILVKNDEINKYKKGYKALEEEYERIRKGNLNLDESNTSRLLILEKNLESTFQKLLVSEKANQKLIAERDALKDDFEQIAAYYQQDVKLKEAEKSTLETKIRNLQQELQKSNINLIHLINNVNENNDTIQHMKSEIQRQIDAKEKLSEMKFSDKINEIQCTSKETCRKLKQQLEAQIELNNKWKTEVPEITRKLEKRLIELKTESVSLKDENAHLKEKLVETEIKLNECKNSLELLYENMRDVIH